VADDEELFLGLQKPRPWWAFWRKANAPTAAMQSSFETPEDWLNTDIKEGLTSAEVERRRKFTGWNELTTEKENMFLKFVGFFRGPILYGRRLAALRFRIYALWLWQ
jgi:H+-transporting ATPase